LERGTSVPDNLGGMTTAYPDSIHIRPVSRPVSGSVQLPGSKSITNRALLIAGLAVGQSVIEDALFSDDTRYLAESLRRLGCAVEEDESDRRFVVDGSGGRFPNDRAYLFVGNAGTAMRFLVAALCVGSGEFRVDGVERMRQRPIGPLVDALRALGATIHYERETGFPPLRIESSGLAGGTVRVPGSLSSQYFSALMMIGPVTERGITIEVDGDLVSKPYIDMTAAVMWAFGGRSEHDAYRRIESTGGAGYHGRRFRVEPDASAASYFFAAAAATGGRVRVEGLSRGSAQGDLRFVEVLARMGCEVVYDESGVEVRGPAQLAGIDVDFRDISDTAMTLAAIAPLAAGPVRIRGIAHIRAKETDRIRAMANELRTLGVAVAEHDDGWTIEPSMPRAGEIATYDDHRIAMSFSILGLRVPGLVIKDPSCVSKTFPDFFDRLDRLTSE
jgi:3-phosphoshikimate 1-carboxyvinyltransferase